MKNSSHIDSDSRIFLFLQGPNCSFFPRLAIELNNLGHHTLRINLCFGDWLIWPRKGASSYRGKLDDWPEYFNNYVKKNKVTDLILLGEQRPYHKTEISIAKELEIDVTVTDFGYLRPGWIILEKDGISGNSCFPKDPVVIKEIADNLPAPNIENQFEDSFWMMTCFEVTYHLLTSLFHFLYPHYRWHHIRHPLLAYISTGLRLLKSKNNNSKAANLISNIKKSKTPFYLYPLQMQNDYQLRAYSHYTDQKDAVQEVIASFSEHAPEDALLIIKIHPWDSGMDDWEKYCLSIAKRYDLENRVKYIDGGNLMTLLENTAGTVMVNSSVGISAVLAGCPITVLGEAVFDVPGLTYQAGLERFWVEHTPPDPKLCDAYIRALVGTVHVKGVYFKEPGLSCAVKESAERLTKRLINKPYIKQPTTI